MGIGYHRHGEVAEVHVLLTNQMCSPHSGTNALLAEYTRLTYNASVTTLSPLSLLVLSCCSYLAVAYCLEDKPKIPNNTTHCNMYSGCVVGLAGSNLACHHSQTVHLM